MKLSTQTKLLFAALAVTALSACGGGGASAPAPSPVAATPTPAPAPAPAPVATPSPAPAPAVTQTATVSPAPSPAPAPVAQPTPAVLQLSVPTPTYTATSAEKQVFDLLNKERGRCGFGLLAQDAKLDASAKNHANYLSLNNVIQHEEDPTKPGFTGATPAARGANVGYGQIVTEALAGNYSPQKALVGLLSAPYHLAGLMLGYKDVGVSYLKNSNALQLDYLVVNPGLKSASDMQLLASNAIGVYPCTGSTDVNYGLYAETPSPVIGRDLLNQPIGTPYLLSMNVGTTITIGSAQLIEVSTGNAVTLREPMTKTNDPNARLLSFQAIIMPDARLKASTSYRYTVTGTSTGVMGNGATIGDCTTTATGSFTCVSTFTTRAEAGVL